MQTDSIEKAVGIGAIGLWAALHGWLGWLVVLYAVCMMLDWVTGTVLAIKNGVWSSHKARQGLWHKCGSIITVSYTHLCDRYEDGGVVEILVVGKTVFQVVAGTNGVGTKIGF